MKYAIVGMGFIFGRHVQAIEATGGQIIMTCDIDPSKNPDYTDWELMMDSDAFNEVDAVVICTPNYLHKPMAQKALALGKQVLCEKPLSIDGVDGLEDVNVVLQLRYAPQLKGLKPEYVSVVAKMYRDDSYWKSWKGNDLKSGGILYNLGIHYIDLLIFLLGEPIKVLDAYCDPKLVSGSAEFERGRGRFHIEIIDSREGQSRSVIVDGKEINLSDKDNLSYENLHTEVYKHFINGDGIPLSEARKSLELVDHILHYER